MWCNAMQCNGRWPMVHRNGGWPTQPTFIVSISASKPCIVQCILFEPHIVQCIAFKPRIVQCIVCVFYTVSILCTVQCIVSIYTLHILSCAAICIVHNCKGTFKAHFYFVQLLLWAVAMQSLWKNFPLNRKLYLLILKSVQLLKTCKKEFTNLAQH